MGSFFSSAYTRIKGDYVQPANAVTQGSLLDWLAVLVMFGITLGLWTLIIRHLKSATL